MTIEDRLAHWEAKFDDVVRRARRGERNLELAAAVCIGATSALRAQIEASQ